jgi:hypothetical protein
MIDKRHAYIMLRIFARLELIASRAYEQGHQDDAYMMWRILGGAQYQCLGIASNEHLEVRL